MQRTKARLTFSDGDELIQRIFAARDAVAPVKTLSQPMGGGAPALELITMSSALANVAWEPCFMEARHDRELEAYARRRMGCPTPRCATSLRRRGLRARRSTCTPSSAC